MYPCYRDKAFNTKQKLAFATQGVEITKEPFESLLTHHGTKEVEKFLKFSPTAMINLTTIAGIIDTPFKPPRPPHTRVILSDWLYYCGVCFTKRHLRKVFKFCFEPRTVHFQGHRRLILLGRYISMSYN